jgi:uncharacterized protein (DUF697 family)
MGIRDFVGILRDLSFSEIRHEAMIPPRILLVSPDVSQGEDWRESIFGEESGPFVEVVPADRLDVDPLAYDAIVSIGPLPPERARSWSELFRRTDEEMRLIEVQPGHSRYPSELYSVRRVICDLCRTRSVAFGRYMESMREAATNEIISDTSRVNAQFAALSNIPALIPVVGGVFAAGADFLVLTKNQLMMMYRLAAIYDRDLDDRFRIYSELTPVVGAGFVWRTTARQIAAVLPFAIGAVPKVAIAYAGTYAIGHGARVYYEFGERLDSDELAQVYRDGLDALERARHRIVPGHNGSEQSERPAIADSPDRS